MTERQKNIIAVLSKHPDLEARIAEMVGIVEVQPGNYKTADEAEEFVMKEIQKFGQELLTEWAIEQEATAVTDVANHKGIVKHEKKTSLGTQPSEK